ncbi:MAG: hypothetical protein LBR15_03570, partial [Methanobrevibacter sp.]|nr:hypothetical protein [Candidatus Methanovirga australis]
NNSCLSQKTSNNGNTLYITYIKGLVNGKWVDLNMVFPHVMEMIKDLGVAIHICKRNKTVTNEMIKNKKRNNKKVH